MLALRRVEWGRLGLLWRSSLYLNSVYLLASNVIAAAFGFLFWTAAARLYAAEAVGIAAATISAIGLLGLLSAVGLDYAIVRFLPHADDPHGIVNSSLTIGATASLVLSLGFIAGLGIWSAGLLPLRQSPMFVAGLAIAVVFTTLGNLANGVFLARKRAHFVFWQGAVIGAGKVVFVIALATSTQAVGLIGAWALAVATAGICSIAFFLPRVEEAEYRPRLMVSRQALNDMTHFAFANYAASVLWAAPTFVLPLLVLNIAGPKANAYFYVALSISTLLAWIPLAVSMSLFAHGSHERHELLKHTIDSGRFILWLLLPAVGAIFLAGDKLLLVFGRAYSEEATRLLWVLALSTLPMAVNFLFFGVNRVRQRMTGVVVCSVWILGATVGLSAAWLPGMGLLGAGVAWLAAQTSAAAVILAAYALGRR